MDIHSHNSFTSWCWVQHVLSSASVFKPLGWAWDETMDAQKERNIDMRRHAHIPTIQSFTMHGVRGRNPGFDPSVLSEKCRVSLNSILKIRTIEGKETPENNCTETVQRSACPNLAFSRDIRSKKFGPRFDPLKIVSCDKSFSNAN